MTPVDLNQPIAKILDDHPDLIDTFINLGFTPLENRALRESVGRFVDLKTGAQMVGVPLDLIIQHLEWQGYEVIGKD